MEHRDSGTRKHLYLYLEVEDRRSGNLLGHLGDISTGGIMIISENNIPLHQEYYARIKLPEEEFNAKYLDVKVETRWHKLDINPDLHCIGCRFTHIDSDDIVIVEELGKLLTFEG
jgi:c-di-GMP-binding flagellar brake protein YcgR